MSNRQWAIGKETVKPQTSNLTPQMQTLAVCIPTGFAASGLQTSNLKPR